MRQFKMSAIPAAHKRGWKILVDGAEITPDLLELKSQWGTLTYGLRPEGYDSWTWQSRSAAVTMPYVIRRGWSRRELLVGLLTEPRLNMGGSALCAIGGFTDPGETLERAQKRELEEEAGLVGHARLLAGPSVAARLFWNVTAPGHEGTYVFVQRVSRRDIQRSGPGEWHFRPNSVPNFRKAADVVFLEWKDAVKRTQDGIAHVALAHMRLAFEEGRL